MAKYVAPGGNRNKNVKPQKSTATMKPATGAAAARSRRMVGAIAAVTPVGRLAKAVTTAAKVSKAYKTANASKTATKASVKTDRQRRVERIQSRAVKRSEGSTTSPRPPKARLDMKEKASAAKRAKGPIEQRGRKRNISSQRAEAYDQWFAKVEKSYDQRSEQMVTGLRGGPDWARARGPRGKNARTRERLLNVGTGKSKK